MNASSFIQEILRDDGPPESCEAFNQDGYLARSVLRLRDRLGLKLVIETGTFEGVTTEWFADHFDRVKSVEILERFFLPVSRRLIRLNLELRLADSVPTLYLWLCQNPNERTLVFLDAHWLDNPLRGELAVIAAAKAKPVLLIHDFQVPNHPELGFDTYPDQGVVYDFAFVREYLHLIYGEKYRAFYNEKATGSQRGCLFVVPDSLLVEAAT